jgi:hypothetical protein
MAEGTGRSIRGAPSRAPATALAWLLTVAIGAPPAAAAPAEGDELRRQVEAALEAADRASEAGDHATAAAREKQDIDAALEVAHATCPGDQIKPQPREDPGPEPPPTAPDPRRSPTRIAGAVTLGVGAGLLVMMAAGLGLGSSAEAAGRDLRREQPTRDIDSLLDADFYRRGRTGNGLALAGGIVGGALVIVGASLLIVGARMRGRQTVARRLRAAGPALEIRF